MLEGSKYCHHCGLTFFHKGDLGYCSGRCRKLSGQPWAQQAEKAIMSLLESREPGRLLNPDEVARMLESDQTTKNWRAAIREVIHAARRLVRQDKIQMTRKGQPVEVDKVRGVIRLRLNVEKE